MKRITIVAALPALAAFAALAVISTTSKHTVPTVYASPASPGCSAATLNGNYAVIQPAAFYAPLVRTLAASIRRELEFRWVEEGL